MTKLIFSITFFRFFFIYIFLIYTKMPKNLSTKYYRENKEILQQKLIKDIKVFLKKKKKKSNKMVMKTEKISEKMKSNILLSIEKINDRIREKALL